MKPRNGSLKCKTNLHGMLTTHPDMYDNVTEEDLDAILNTIGVEHARIQPYDTENLDNSQSDHARYFIGTGNSRNRVPMVDCRRF